MAVIIDPQIPSARRLAAAGMEVIAPGPAAPDCRVGLLNLMPNREDTEYDFMQLIAPAPLRTEIVLMEAATHRSRRKQPEYVASHYTSWGKADPSTLDGLIVTGAPLDFVAFTDVDYWHEIVEIMDHSMAMQLPTLHVCWGAYAAMYHRYSIGMTHYPEKLHGIFDVQQAIDPDGLLLGLPQSFPVPFSRFATWPADEAELCPGILTVARNSEAGIYIARDSHAPHYYITGHVEYDALTLHREYCRDTAKGMTPRLPRHYYPADNPALTPANRWRVYGLKIFSNWLKSITQ